MKRCTNCFMPVTKPGVELDDNGHCQGCTHHELRHDNDYEARFERLEAIADEFRREDGNYDCLIPVSGGKDSHYQTWLMKEKLDLNPLLLAVTDPFTHTETGERNLRNLSEAFDCDIVVAQTGIETVRKMVRVAFEEFGSPTWPIDRAIYCVPIRYAIDFDIPLVVYGENTAWEYGGVLYDHQDDEPYSALDQIENDVAKPVDFDLWKEEGISEADLNMMRYPSMDEIEDAELEPIYLSYFTPWDGYENYRLAKKYGFRDLHHEWEREGFIEAYDQIDSIGYLINVWMKYPKMGYARTTDVVGYRRRSEHFDISLAEGRQLIEANDYQLDQRILDDFLDFTGYSDHEFWKIAESHRNEDIFDESFLDPGPVPKPVDDFENIPV